LFLECLIFKQRTTRKDSCGSEGHTIGLRHTDFFNRSISCGTGGDEGEAGVGAIHIPGTPETVNVDMNSVMLSCFTSYESGEFSNFDISALEWMY
jgi:hypothetical protein